MICHEATKADVEFSRRKESTRNRAFFILLAITALTFCNVFMMNPLTAGYTTQIGGNAVMIGFISGAMGTASLLTTPICGVIVNRINSKRLALGSYSLLFIASLLYYFAPNASVFLLARYLHGVSFGFTSVLLATTVSNLSPSAVIGKTIGMYSAVQAVAQGVAPSLGILIRNNFGYRSAMLMSILFAGAILLLLLVLSPFSSKKSPSAEPIRIRFSEVFAVELIPLFLGVIGMGFLLHMIMSYLDPFTRLTGFAAGMDMFYIVYAAGMILTRLLFAGIMDRKHMGFFVLLCCPIAALSFYVIQIQQSRAALWLAASLAAFGIGGLQTAFQVYMNKVVDQKRRGVANSTYYIAVGLGHTLGGAAGAYILASPYAYGFFYLMMSGCILPVLLAALFPKQYFHSQQTHLLGCRKMRVLMRRKP